MIRFVAKMAACFAGGSVLAAASITVATLTTPGCGAGRAVCPLIHVADEVCPYILVELPGGGQEPVLTVSVQQLALDTRQRRLAAESTDGGSR